VSVVGAGRARAGPADQCLEVRESGAGGERRGLDTHPRLPIDQAEDRGERDPDAGIAVAKLVPVQKLAGDARRLDEGPPLRPLGEDAVVMAQSEQG